MLKSSKTGLLLLLTLLLLTLTGKVVWSTNAHLLQHCNNITLGSDDCCS
jgi:hypothetical protein